MGKHVFVTVGTTRFDALIEAVDRPAILSGLLSRGFTSLTVQIGHGDHVPAFSATASDPGRAKTEGMECEWYRFKPTLQEDMARADLVISHGGAGSVMEALGLGKVLVVVVNNALMGNHQAELADALAKRNYLRATTPEALARTLADFDDDPMKRTPYPAAKPEAFSRLVDAEMCGAQRDGRR